MRIFFIFLLLPFLCAAQKMQPIYYDWQWKKCDPSLARFVSLITKTDSGWVQEDYYLSNNLLQMKGLYKDSAGKIRNGGFRYYYHNGRLSSTGNYVNNKKEGLWLSYHNNGMMSDSTVYANDKPSGISFGWYANGFVADSISYNSDGTSVEVDWFDNGSPAGAGRTFNGKKTGKWNFFHRNGIKAATEIYDGNGNITEALYYDENGEEVKKPVYEKRDATFAGGIEKWKSYILKKLTFPPTIKLVNTDRITVVITALINEDGEVLDAYVEVPFKKPFDDEALRVVKKSPKWIPAASHNRRVPMYIRQPITFAQIEE